MSFKIEQLEILLSVCNYEDSWSANDRGVHFTISCYFTTVFFFLIQKCVHVMECHIHVLN